MQTGRVKLTETQVQGFPAFTLENGLISLTIVPELGGKLSSIQDQRTGREWLWNNTQRRYKHNDYNASYGLEGDTGGWDECFPTVAACKYPLAPWQGIQVPDHGELWTRSWPTYTTGNEALYNIHSQANGTAFPYRFERTITISENSDLLRFHYRITSLSEDPFAYIWSAHPLFQIEPGMRLHLPAGTAMHNWLSVPEGLLSTTGTHSWPVQFRHNEQSYTLDTLPSAEAKLATKLWSERLTTGNVELTASNGSFRFSFDPEEIPGVGLWLNSGMWPDGPDTQPYYTLGLEPCIGAQDSLAEAVEHYQNYRILPAREQHNWTLHVQIQAHEPSPPFAWSHSTFHPTVGDDIH